MKFNLNDFMELDTKELLGVNGGGSCGGTSRLSGGKAGRNSDSPSTGGRNGGGCSSVITGGGACGGTSGREPSRSGGNCSSTPPPSNGGSDQGSHGNDDGTSISGYPRNNHDGTTTDIRTREDGTGVICTTDSATGEVISRMPHHPYNGNKPYETGTPSAEPVPSETGKNSGTREKSGGGYCSGASDGKTRYDNPYYSNQKDDNKSYPVQNGAEVSGGGGSSDGSSNTQAETSAESGTSDSPDVAAERVAGTFGQITDGSYADKLTMQYYKKNPKYMFHPDANDEAMVGTYKDKDGNVHECTFSKVGCKEVASAKIASEIVGDDVSLVTVNNIFDANQDGDLTAWEVATGIDKLLDMKYGDIYDVSYSDRFNITEEILNEISNPADDSVSYVLGSAPACHGGHWVTLEGYSKGSDGVVSFDYDGSSDNDKGRSFVLGTKHQDSEKEIWGITRIQIFTVLKK